MRTYFCGLCLPTCNARAIAKLIEYVPPKLQIESCSSSSRGVSPSRDRLRNSSLSLFLLSQRRIQNMLLGILFFENQHFIALEFHAFHEAPCNAFLRGLLEEFGPNPPLPPPHLLNHPCKPSPSSSSLPRFSSLFLSLSFSFASLPHFYRSLIRIKSNLFTSEIRLNVEAASLYI